MPIATESSLEPRIQRLRLVIAALEERRRQHDEAGGTPLPLLQALAGFREELRACEQRLRDGGASLVAA